MKHELFSAYAAARVLERDRQTIERATRGLAPDGYERGQPRWRLARIVDRLARRDGWATPACDPALQARFDQLDALDERLRSAPTLQQRRKLARELFPLLADVDHAMRDEARRAGEDARLTGLRCDEHTRILLATLREPCGWSFEQILTEYNTATEPTERKRSRA